MNRREALLGFVGSIPLLYYGFSRVLQHLGNGIEADRENLQNFIQFNLYGAPSRWVFDNPLDPYGSNFIKNPYVGTTISDAENTSKNSLFSYDYIRYKTANLPYLWHQSRLGTEFNLTPLADSMIVVRGVHMINDGHEPANQKLFLSKLASSKKPLGNFVMGGASLAHEHKLHKEERNTFISSYREFDKSFQNTIGRAKNQEKVNLDLIINNLKKIRDLNSTNSLNAYNNRISNLKLTNNILETFIYDFPSILEKYQNIFLLSKKLLTEDKLLPGLFDKPLKGFNYSNDTKIDLIGRFYMTDHILTQPDIRSGFSTVTMDMWIYQFAIAEFLVRHNLSSNIFLGPDKIGNFFENYSLGGAVPRGLVRSFSGDFGKIKQEMLDHSFVNIRMDTHKEGSMINNLSASYFFYIFMNCLAELVDRLKEQNIFDDTLIHVTSEFDRIPQSNEAGSQHSLKGQVSSFFSGRIKEGPIFLGDTSVGAETGLFQGSYGEGVANSSLKRFVNYLDLQRSITNLFNKAEIGGDQIFMLHRGKIIPSVNLAKNV